MRDARDLADEYLENACTNKSNTEALIGIGYAIISTRDHIIHYLREINETLIAIDKDLPE